MAVLPRSGKLSVNQGVGSATAEDSENVINMGSVIDAPDDMFLDIETSVAASGSGALTIDVVLSDREALDTNTVKVFSIVMASEADKRILAAGNHVYGGRLPRELRELAKTLSYQYLGLIYTPTSTLAVSFNAAITPAEPRTKDNQQVVVSNVGVPTA
ncbi:MAG: hypothetical protein PHQ00_00035 [Phycisphaerae bacterium]|nr:hypothetical protein [Phycisphaerae bacterium]